MNEANNLPPNNNSSIANSEPNLMKQEVKTTHNESEKEKEIDWHKLAHKLREHNRKLLKKVFQLEQEIVESNQALAEQTKRSQSNDLYKAQQAEKLNQYQAEIAELQQKIVAYQQESRGKQAVIESLNQTIIDSQQQVEDSQVKIVNLERECVELHAANETKQKELKAHQQQIQELNTRFQRQQQYLLEYKAKNPETNLNQPIKAWSAHSTDKASAKSAVSPSIKSPDWPAPAISKTHKSINSIAAVRLPKFPRQAEGE